MYDFLKHLRVVEGSAFVAAPLAGMTLAQLGADVIRFDAIGGGIDYVRWPLAKKTGRSFYWTGLNKSKRSIAVNLQNPKGRELIQALITEPGEGRGIFLTNFAGVKWLSYEELKSRRPDVIKLELQGNHDGSSAVDYTVNCAVGYPVVTGDGTAEKPLNHVLPAWDLVTGMHAALGIVAAVEQRAQSGAGQHIKLALSDMAFSSVAHLGHIAEAQVDGSERGHYGNDIYGAYGRDFGTKDGRRIMVTALSEKQWAGLCRATGLTETMDTIAQLRKLDFTTQSGRFEGRDAISAFIGPWCEDHTLAEIKSAFDANGVCWGTYQSFKQMVADDPRVSERNPMFQMIDQPGIGRHLAPGLPLDFVGRSRLPVQPAPWLGEHTDEVLADVLGLSASEIGRLHDEGVVAGPEPIA